MSNKDIRGVLAAEIEQHVTPDERAALGLDLPAGAGHYRAWVGPPSKYDVLGALQFQALTDLGLREYHRVCEVGCGSLRVGRLLISYLLDGHYYGIEPNVAILQEGLREHFGWDGPGSWVMHKKKPRFYRATDFDISFFGVEFDFILAQSVISHTGAAETELFFRQCAKAMTSNTTVLFTFVQGAKNCEEDGWFYPACVTYTPEYMRELADRHGLSIEIVEWPPLNRHEGGLISGQTPTLLRLAAAPGSPAGA
jgi:SAM-dependent methyltransferase